MEDLVDRAARSGFVVFYEEVARDGAQGKTLLQGHQRVSIARRHSDILGAHASSQLVFTAGFPSAGKNEFEAVRRVVDEVDCCYLTVVGRATREDVDLLLRSIQGARYGRVCIGVPTSVDMGRAMLHRTPQECLSEALNIVDHILGFGAGCRIDIGLIDTTRSDVGFVAEAAMALTQAGAAMMVVCDTVGCAYPRESGEFFSALKGRTADSVSFVAHMHNDLGFGLINTLEALKSGIRGVTSSWLGLGERAGMAATEQLLFALSHEPERLAGRLGVSGNIWHEPPSLKGVAPLARYVSQTTGRVLSTTDPIVGTGVNSISTGTPFVNPGIFQPYDPEQILGIPPQVLLTPLASKRVIAVVAERLGFKLGSDEINASLNWIKTEAFDRGVPVIEEVDFVHFLRQMPAPRIGA